MFDPHASKHGSPLPRNLAALLTAVLSACSGGGGEGGGGGTPIELDPRVLAFEGTWQIQSALAELQRAGCGATGLDSGILSLEAIGGLVDDGTHIAAYRVTSPSLDTRSPVGESYTTLEAVAFTSGPGDPDVFFFLGGVYYCPANDVTVDVALSLPGAAAGDQDTFQVDLDYAIYEGYQITAEPLGENDFDDDDDGQVDEEDEQGFAYVADPEAFLLCEGELRVEGTRGGQAASVTYSGVAAAPTGPLEPIPLVARHHPDLDGIEFVFGSDGARAGSQLAEVRGDSFRGLQRNGEGWTLISGRGSREVLAGTIVELDAEGRAGLQREFRALRVEGQPASGGSLARGVAREGGATQALRSSRAVRAAAAAVAARR